MRPRPHKVAIMEFHISRRARDRYEFDDSLFSLQGNVILANFHAARVFAQRMNEKRDLVNFPEQAVQPGDLNAMGLIDELLHKVVQEYREADRVAPRVLLELPVDVLLPCARPNSIDVENAARLQARAVSPGANDPIAPGAEEILVERGVVVVPDFVANLGGVLGGTMRFAAVGEARIETFLLESVGTWIDALLGREPVQRAQDHVLAVARLLELELCGLTRKALVIAQAVQRALDAG